MVPAIGRGLKRKLNPVGEVGWRGHHWDGDVIGKSRPGFQGVNQHWDSLVVRGTSWARLETFRPDQTERFFLSRFQPASKFSKQVSAEPLGQDQLISGTG